jgi:DNA-binding response OmpR family regulator
MEQQNILILEDNTSTRDLISNILYKENYRVFEAANISQSIDIFDNHKIDIVCLDLVLRKEHGLDFLLYAKKKNTETKFIIITNLTSRAARIEAFKSGIEDYIPKPFLVEELIFRVKKVANQPKCKEYLEFADFKLCISNKTFCYLEYEFSLTSSEYYILEYMFKHNGMATIKNLSEYCSYKKSRYSSVSSTIICIKRLRDKFKKSSGHSFIRTRYGIGYYLA